MGRWQPPEGKVPQTRRSRRSPSSSKASLRAPTEIPERSRAPSSLLAAENTRDFVPVGRDQRQHLEFARDWGASGHDTPGALFGDDVALGDKRSRRCTHHLTDGRLGRCRWDRW
ncbi:MAG: hypothetical protein Q8L14_02715 [Myxococcales bacterium]|nr:hypothetical protein [Myxococcales bacterium]